MSWAVTNKPTLKILHWNSNGIRGKIRELQDFLVEYEIDLVLLSETHLKPSHPLKVRNFNAVRWDRPNRQGGGVAVLVKRGIAFSTPQVGARSLEVAAVTIPIGNRNLRVVAGYKPPPDALDPSDITSLLDGTDPVILAGDLNTKHLAWGSTSCNAAGIVLFNTLNDNGHTFYAPGGPTHFPPPDVLDIAVSNNIPWSVNSQVKCELTSDHNPVILTLEEVNLGSSRMSFSKVNWEDFADTLEKAKLGPISLKSGDEINNAVNDLTKHIMGALNNATTVVDSEPGTFLPREVRELKRLYNRSRAEAQRYWDPQSAERSCEARSRYRRALNEYSNNSWDRYLESLELEDNSLWRATKRLTKTSHDIPLLKCNGVYKTTDMDKAEALAEAFENQFSPNPATPSSPVEAEVLQEVETYTSSDGFQALSPTTPKEVKFFIKRLKNNKAPGQDGLKNSALKHLPMKVIARLTSIFNACFFLTFFPDPFKEAIVVPIQKANQSSCDPTSYRPISLLPSLGKLLESLILKRMRYSTRGEEYLRDEQFGFRARLCTTRQLSVVTERITKGFNNHEATGGVFFDIAKAFDRTWHPGVLLKMVRYQFPCDLVKLFASYLKGRSFRVRVKAVLSTAKRITAGVPQGSVLGPGLFSLFINDMPCPEGVSLHLYADDTAALTTSKSVDFIVKRLQSAADAIADWCKKWRVVMNPKKTEAVLFRATNKRKFIPRDQVTFFGTKIPWSKQVKYLGVVLDSALKFSSHIQARLQIANRMKGCLNAILSSRKVALSCKRRIYTAMLRPTLLYASQVWITTSPSNMRRLEQYQAKVLRKITAAPAYVRNTIIQADLKIDPIQEYISKMALRFYSDPDKSGNRPLMDALDYNEKVCQDYKLRPRQLLFLRDPDPLHAEEVPNC
jgi:hypothetical protein